MSLRRQHLPDFLQPVSGPGAWAWAWCATGLAVLAAAGVDALAAHGQRQQALQALRKLNERPMARAAGTTTGWPAQSPALAPPKTPAIVQGKPPANAQAGAQASAQAWQAWQQRLAYPWPQVFLAAEAAAADGVAWLSLVHTPGQALLLEGEAASPAVALATAAQLQRWVSADGSTWGEASLLRLERLARSAPGQRLAISLQSAHDAVPISAAGRQPP